MVFQALWPILVVDDDDDIRLVICEVLADVGYVVSEAPDGKPVLERLRASEQGMVVLLDINMPGMNGIQVLQTIAAQDELALRHIFVLVTAHYDSLPDEVLALLQRLGISVLAKPFDLDDLLVTVHAAEQALDGRVTRGPVSSHADTDGFLSAH